MFTTSTCNKEMFLFAGGSSMSNILQAMEVSLILKPFFWLLLCQGIDVGSDKMLR